MTERRTFNMSEMLASLICEKLDIPLEHQKLMTVDQVLSLVHGDHYPIRYEAGGPTQFWNCTVLALMAHREKTAKKDIPEIAKGKRLRRSESERRLRRGILLAEDVEFVVDDANPGVVRRPDPIRDPDLFPPKRREPSRLQGRGFDKTKSRGFSGKVTPRKPRRQRQ